jgi:ABC-type bacteriocin/lantibiotic exporter with double-glycine peptidase domain
VNATLTARASCSASQPAVLVSAGAHAGGPSIWFRYSDDGRWILQGYNLRVRAGESFVLRDPSGMGKTTILRLIADCSRRPGGR